jgi:uncharacterized membrane protein
MGKFLKHWLVAFIALFILDLVWHLLIAGKFYEAQLVGTQRYDAGGKLAPLIPFVVLSDVIVSFGYTWLVTSASSVNRKYVLNGLVVGLMVVGSYTILNHAILPNWPLGVVAVDILQAAIFGLGLGFVFKWLNRPSAGMQTPTM